MRFESSVGNEMRRLDDLYDEFAAALQFPDYFGENWDAFEECLSDLEWIPSAGYAPFIANAVQVLDEEPEGQFQTFVKILATTCEEWTRSQTPKPFHVLLQCTEGDVENLRRRAKSALVDVPTSRLGTAR